jgi:hypothetical protein
MTAPLCIALRGCGGHVPTGTDASEEMVGVEALIKELHEASTEAVTAGYPRMARLLDDAGFELGAANPDNRRPYVERARKSLAVWRALRAW